MQPNEKIVQVAEQFLDGIGSPANVDWFVVEADLQIVGYELFGTHDFKKIAGLEATTGLATSICYPFIDISSEVAHGISVVNVNADPQDVTFNLIDDQGKVLASVTKNLNGHQKFTDTIEAMFSSFNFSASQAPGWLEVRGSAPLAGFELFLNTTNDEQMGALIAQ